MSATPPEIVVSPASTNDDSQPNAPQQENPAPRRKASHARANSIDIGDLSTASSKHHQDLHPPKEKREHKRSSFEEKRPSLDLVRRHVERLEGRTRQIRNRASFEISRLPSLRIEGDTHDKRVHWGELFGDLMYILAVQALGKRFAHHPTLLEGVAFLGLYLAVYWSWCGEVMYLDRFETNDLLHRVALFIEMVGVMFMVLALRGNNDQLSLLFPISYIIIRSLFVVLYGRIGLHVNSARKLAFVHASMLAASVSIWLGSIFVPQPWNYVLWAAALFLDLLIPVITYRMERKIPLNHSHMGERLGLFIIIDLGEMVLSTVRGLGEHIYAGPAVLSIFYGISVAYSCWWLYFDEAGFTIGKRPKVLKHALQRFNWISKFWFYNHFFLNVSLTTVGVGIELLVHHATKHGFVHHAPTDARWVFAAGLIAFLAALGGVHLAHHGLEFKQKLVKALVRISGSLVGLTITAAAGSRIPTWLFILLLLCINVAQILFDLLFHESWVIRAADRRKALAKAMSEKFKENAERDAQRQLEYSGRDSVDEPRPMPSDVELLRKESRSNTAGRHSLDLPRRPPLSLDDLP